MPRKNDDHAELNLNPIELPDNKEDFQLIWLDGRLTKSSETHTTKNMLRKLNTNAQFYTDVDQCLGFILSIKTEHIFLVVSGSLARVILPRLQGIRLVSAVFIFCEQSELHSNLLKEYPRKIVDIYSDRHDLIKSITNTMKLVEKQDMAFRMFDCKQKSTRDLTKESASFLWNQLLVDVLRKMPTDELAKNDMLDYCSVYYRNNREELKKIQSFRTSYTPNDAIKYYTADSFLYKLLNKALRTEDITLLYTFRFFIIDLCAQLDIGKRKLLEKENEPLTLYRGQQIPKDELENLKNNIGALIATNGFVSTSRNPEVSLGFSQSSLSRFNEDMIQVQMIIKADPKAVKRVIFADISRQSDFQLEEEVLFSLGAVFRIDEYEFDNHLSIGKIFLTATDEGSATLESYLNAQKHQLQMYSPLIYFGRLLMHEMNEVDRAREYFYTLLKTLPNDHSDIPDVYNQIGATHYMKAQKMYGTRKDSELSQALEMFEKTLDMRVKICGDNDIRIAMSLNNIGSVYNDRNNFDRALDCYQRGLEIIENSTVECSIFKANLTWNCGILKERMDDTEAALHLYLKADNVYTQYLPIHHPTNIKSATGIARLFENMSEIYKALEYYKRIFEYCVAMLLPSDEQCKNSWTNVVHCCLKLNCEQDAITYLNRMLKMCERDPSSMQKTSNEYIALMITLCEDDRKFNLTIDYYKILFQSDATAKENFLSLETTDNDIEILKFRLSAYQQLFPVNDTQHAHFLVKIGHVFYFDNLTDLAHECCQKALNIYESTTYPLDAESYQICWKQLIDIYFNEKNERSILNLLEQVLKKEKQFSDNGSTVIICLQYIADKYKANNDIHSALYYLEKAMKHVEINKSYCNIRPIVQKFLTFYEEEEQEKIIEDYIRRAVDVCYKDSVESSKCYWLLYDWCEMNDMKEKALKYFECFLIATEENHSSSKEKLDEIWIDFVLVSRSGIFTFGPVGESMELLSLMQICRRHLSSIHFKNAIILWKSGALHETIKMTSASLDFYSEATDIFEKLIYNQNDNRTKQALNYLLFEKYGCTDAYSTCVWLKSTKLSHLATFSFASEHDKWKCILQRLKILKMNHIDNQWEFHSTIEHALLDRELCSILLDNILDVCKTQMNCVENETSLDIYSIICCFEFISHWYLSKGEFLESLFFRQGQLELESKIFTNHPHIAWSLWFIGLIFQQTKEYDLSLGYFTRAAKIFERLHTKEHNDIQNLEKCISQVRDMTSSTDLFRISKSKTMMHAQQNRYMPHVLQMPFHID